MFRTQSSMKTALFLATAISVFFLGCQSSASNSSHPVSDSSSVVLLPETTTPAPDKAPEPATAAEILAKKEVPVLCYHQVRDYTPNDSKTARPYIVPVNVFREQMQALADSGYQTI